MRRLRFLLPLALGVPAFAAVVAEPLRPLFIETPLALPALPVSPQLGLTAPFAAPTLSMPTAAVAAAVPTAAPVAAAPALAAIAAQLPTASAAAPDGLKTLANAFDGTAMPAPSSAVSLDGFGAGADGALAPDLPAIEKMTRALFARYLPRLYRPLPIRFEYETSKFGRGGGGGHDFDPELGHTIALGPGDVDARGNVESAVGERTKIRVQSKIEQLFTSVHEYAHAVFDDAVGRDIGRRPPETAYDAMTEGFAVEVERLVLAGMLRDAKTLGLSARDVTDIRGILKTRRQWLIEEESPYAEGAPVWAKAHATGGEAGMLALLSSLRSKRLMETKRSDGLYQLSLGDPETTQALLGDGEPSVVRAGFEAAARAVAGLPLDPAQRASAGAAIDAAGPAGWDWLIHRALSRESNFGTAAEPLWIVPVFLRNGGDLTAPLFRLASLSRGLAERTAQFLAGTAARPEGATRLFEDRGLKERFDAIASGAESLPWTPEAKKAWLAAVQRWIAAVPK
jgi:hypothetical protein